MAPAVRTTVARAIPAGRPTAPRLVPPTASSFRRAGSAGGAHGTRAPGTSSAKRKGNLDADYQRGEDHLSIPRSGNHLISGDASVGPMSYPELRLVSEAHRGAPRPHERAVGAPRRLRA